MLFWILAAFLTFAATLALMLPILRRRASATASAEGRDVEVYRDQLAEIERDLKAGILDADEAQIARAEIGRRLIGAARRGDAAVDAAAKIARRPSRLATAAILVFMPVAAIAGYLQFGSPGLSQQPLAARVDQDREQTDIALLVADAERHLVENPDDGRGWDVLAPIYLRSGRVDDAEAAFRRSIALLGPSASRQAGLGEALVAKAGGIVSDEARLVFQSARELDPEDPRPAFFLAVDLAQDGRTEEARAAFASLLRRAPEGAPWVPAVRRQIAALDNDSGFTAGPATGAASGDGDKSAAERAETARKSVASLEKRLEQNPRDLERWQMLIRSRARLGDLPGAQSALDRASTNFPSGAEARALVALAEELALKPNTGLGGVPLAESRPSGGDRRTAGADLPGPFIMPDGRGRPAEPPRDPTDDEIAAAEAMSGEQRNEMIRGMVASLDEKLRAEPDNLEGWLRLVRSYAVLGDTDAARDALARAGNAFPDNGEAEIALDRLAGELLLVE